MYKSESTRGENISDFEGLNRPKKKQMRPAKQAIEKIGPLRQKNTKQRLLDRAYSERREFSFAIPITDPREICGESVEGDSATNGESVLNWD